MFFLFPITLPLLALLALYVVGCFLVELEYFAWTTVLLIATVVGVQYLHVYDIFTFVKENALTSLLYTVGYITVGVAWSFVKWFSYLMKYRDKFRELKQNFLDQNKIPSSSTPPESREVSHIVGDAFEKYVSKHYTAKTRRAPQFDNQLEIDSRVAEVEAAAAERAKLWVAFLEESKTSDNQTIPATLKESFDSYLRSQWVKSDYATLKLGQKPTAVNNKAKITAWMAFWPCSVISTLLNDPIRRLFRFLFNTFKALYQKMADAVFANDPELK